MQPTFLDPSKSITERLDALMAELTVEEKLDQLHYRNKGISRLNMLPYVWWNEALHGLARAGAATVFPQAIGMAATFSPELVKKMGKVIALEGRARHHEAQRKGDYGTYKGLTFWSPNVNIFRDPRWGRGHETYGEDPFLTGLFGSAFVRGVQGDDPRYVTAVATPKHYAVHSGPEATRLSFNSQTDERDLRETYLPAFKACIKAGALSVMGAYNAYNGVACVTNAYLLNTILREEWGFEGAVVSDAGAGEALYKEHKAVADYPEAIAAELTAGIDVLVDWEEGVYEAYERGLLTPEMIDRAVRRQLFVKFKLGFFDDPAGVPLAETPYEVIECPEHRALARQATRESLVLLKNTDHLLPLHKEQLSSIAVIGPNADDFSVLLGNYYGTPTRHSTILQGILHAVPETCRVWYARGCEHLSPRTESCAEDYDRIAEAVSVAERSELVLLCLGLTPGIEGEAGDAFNSEAGGDRRGIELPEIQERLLAAVLATGTPVVVLMLTGSAIFSPTIDARASALLHCWYPGAEAGQVIAEVLFGEASPSGRLPVTFYIATSDLPDFTSYDMTNRTYRYFTGKVAYPFGYGLSYTTFAYRDLSVARTDGIALTVKVKNTGTIRGDEVVQVYASMRRNEERTPLRSLVALQRVTLDAGEEREVQLKIQPEQLQLFDEHGKQYLSPGPCMLSVGGSQNDARSIALTGVKPLETTIEL